MACAQSHGPGWCSLTRFLKEEEEEEEEEEEGTCVREKGMVHVLEKGVDVYVRGCICEGG